MVTGSMSVMDGGMMPVSVPPMTGSGAPLPLGSGEAVVPPLSSPQAASMLPIAVAPRPSAVAPAMSWRRVILPLRTWSTM
jgi:hypothetical protein